ncbi:MULTISPECIES: outer membrane protein assembly factor BamB [Pseudomonas]|uniref:Outer membrane protein assembly factor BamB n=1 Tax=Pseudomonas oryzihabitans TaxID=47885 RepID=A0A2Z5AED5_9PSED|nr:MULTISPECIES: outer membrane protein assembly factor BamB [Pseudomonas]AXA68296.1 outer membrane protein assembly factor BamB [Pseudomonas oryzihabitans]
MLRWKPIAVLGLALAVVGCSSTGKKELPPAELKDIKAEVRLDEVWSRSVGDGQGKEYNRLVPAVDGQTIFAADADGRVMAMNRETGQVLWKKDLDLPVSGGVGVGSGLVLVGTLRGQVIALDSASGDEKWRAQASSEVLSAPVVNNDVVVVQSQDDKLQAFELGSGTRRWIYEDTQPVLSLRGTGAPLVTNQVVMAGFASGKVVALDVQRGLPLWEQQIAVPKGRSELERIVDVDGGLSLSGDTLYVVSYNGRVAALNPANGQILWQRDASSYDGVAEGFGNVYLSLDNGTVEAVEESSTSSLWTNADLARRQLTGPVVWSSNLVVGDYAGYIHLLSQVDGRFVGRTKVDGDGVRVRPLVVGDMLYVYGNGGKLVAYRLR